LRRNGNWQAPAKRGIKKRALLIALVTGIALGCLAALAFSGQERAVCPKAQSKQTPIWKAYRQQAFTARWNQTLRRWEFTGRNAVPIGTARWDAFLNRWEYRPAAAGRR
jgi:hypothetical protein